jgi:hypothetical protein
VVPVTAAARRETTRAAGDRPLEVRCREHAICGDSRASLPEGICCRRTLPGCIAAAFSVAEVVSWRALSRSSGREGTVALGANGTAATGPTPLFGADKRRSGVHYTRLEAYSTPRQTGSAARAALMQQCPRKSSTTGTSRPGPAPPLLHTTSRSLLTTLRWRSRRARGEGSGRLCPRERPERRARCASLR